MGQAWCKERSSKAQDSKSPFDRVFLRCAHRLYPGLKEEGSVLGGATQRVTSSEIGYAGSPPREMLTRGRSIDSVDRPFQPSDWVDVNLEVPSTPRASSVMTNHTMDTTLYHTTTPTSSCSNLKDPTPIPPPRRKKMIRDRPLPPKPDEASSYSDNEPLYSSVNKVKSNYMKNDNKCNERKRVKEVYEYKMNGTGQVIPSTVVSGWKSDDKLSSQQLSPISLRNGRPMSTVSLPNYDKLEASRHEKQKKDGENKIGEDEVDLSFDLSKELRLNTGKTSTPMKEDQDGESRNPIKVDGWFSGIDSSKRFSDSSVPTDDPKTEVSNNQSEELKSRVQSYLFSEGSKDDLFFDAEDTKRTCSLDRNRESEPKKTCFRKRSLSNESEPFDSFEEKRLSVAPSSQTDSSPKNLTRSISEESFPSALMEDPDEPDFFEEKIVKDTKNEITKIREELEAVKNEVKTPPPSPEPKIRPELQSNDHSSLLKVLRDEAEESNLSSMTPSLTELEAALSDMLEKEDDQENYSKISTENIPPDNFPENPLEKPIEPKILPIIGEEKTPELMNVDLKNGDMINGFSKIRSLDRDVQMDPPEKPSRLLRISLDSLENSGNVPTPPKRRNRSSNIYKENSSPESHYNDRLI